MWIIGVDYHPSVQQIAFVNTDTGECGERRLSHSDGEAEKFYRELKAVCRAECEPEIAHRLDCQLRGRWKSSPAVRCTSMVDRELVLPISNTESLARGSSARSQ